MLHCNKRTRVTDSRLTPVGIRRRRECVVCGQRFSTLEMLNSQWANISVELEAMKKTLRRYRKAQQEMMKL